MQDLVHIVQVQVEAEVGQVGNTVELGQERVVLHIVAQEEMVVEIC